MAIPILGQRKERKQAALVAAVADAIEKAGLSPALASQSQVEGIPGATYPVTSNSGNNPLNPSSPFTQTGGSNATPLPRPWSDFGSLFGPGFPLAPDALDPLRQDGRADPRRTQYPVTVNLNLLDRETSWTVLRKVATEVDVVNRCIELLQDSIVGLDWSFGFSKQILNQIMSDTGETNSAKATALAREQYGNELTRVQQFFEYPDPRMGQTFSTWLTAFIWAHLVYDGVAVYPQKTLGGELYALSLLDTATIKILLDNQGFIPQPPAPAYQQIIYGFPRGEFQAEGVTDDGDVPNAYQFDQLAYYIRRPRLHSIYGYSTVEECINIASLYMNRQEWMHSEWSHGVTPKLIVTTEGTETWTPEQLAYYEQVMNDRLSGQTRRRQNMFMLRPGMAVEQLKEMAENYSSAYDEWLVMQIGAKFGVPQSQLGIQMRSSIGGGSQTNEQTSQSDKFATSALINFLIDCINDLARRFLGVGPEITATCTGGDDSDDDLTRAQADASDVNAGIRSRNEIRAERGIPLASEPEADQLGVTSPTGVTFLSGLIEQQAASAQASIAGSQNAAMIAQNPSLAAEGQNVPGMPSPNGNAASGPKSVPGADGTSQGGTSASVGASKPNVGTSASIKPVASNTNATPASVAPKSTAASVSAAKKELDAFGKFARARVGRNWRDFEFTTLTKGVADALNDMGASNNLDEIRIASMHVLAKDSQYGQEGTQALRDWYNNGADGAINWGEAGDFDDCVAIAGKYIDNPEGYCQNRHIDATGDPAGKAPGESADKSVKINAAGFVVKADDTGRVLLVQRSIQSNSRPGTAGLFEWPGGKLEDGETPLEAAQREWTEEVGLSLPNGKIVGSWTTTNGYQGFVCVIKHEASIDLDNADRKGKEIENVVWWNVNDLQANPAVRPEVQQSDWALIGHASKSLIDLPPEDYMNFVGRDAWPNARVEVVELDYFGKPSKPLGNGDRIIVERGLGKANARGNVGHSTTKWSQHAIHAFHDKIAKYYAAKLAEALRTGTSGIREAVGQAVAITHPAITAKAVGDPAAVNSAGIVNANVKIDPDFATQILRQLYGDSFLAGAHVAAQQVSGNVPPDFQETDAAIDWSSWTPGWAAAANLEEFGGLQSLLDNAGITIQGITSSAMDRLATALGDGLAAGDSVDTIANSMSGVVDDPDRAYVIANTETNRAMSEATQDTYSGNGIAQFEWLAEDDACETCLALQDGNPYDVDSGDELPPDHPNCRCALLPVIPGITDQDDDSSESES